MLTRRCILGSGLALPFTDSIFAAEREARVVLLGQALLQHNLNEAQWPEKGRFQSLLAGADICFSDLETSIKGPGGVGTSLRKGEFLHSADADVLDCLDTIHINMLATSNNHAFDLGPAGIDEAIGALDARGITHAGTGANLAIASAPAYRTTGNGRFALVATATGNIAPGGNAQTGKPGVNEIRRDPSGDLNAADVQRILSAVKVAARNSTFVIVYHHNHYWQPNMADTPPWQRTFAKLCIASGAHAFVSHGAPLLHGIEIYNGKPIFYDLGGLFFQTVTEPGHYPPEVWQGAIMDCRCALRGITRIRLIPVQLNDTGLDGSDDMVTRGMPSIARGANAQSILKRLSALSAAYNTRIEMSGDEAVIAL